MTLWCKLAGIWWSINKQEIWSNHVSIDSASCFFWFFWKTGTSAYVSPDVCGSECKSHSLKDENTFHFQLGSRMFPIVGCPSWYTLSVLAQFEKGRKTVTSANIKCTSALFTSTFSTSLIDLTGRKKKILAYSPRCQPWVTGKDDCMIYDWWKFRFKSNGSVLALPC